MKKALITGGGGFVGKAVVRGLLLRGVDCSVVGRSHYPELERMGVECCCGDVRDREFLVRCLKGVDTVFHIASLAGIWGEWSEYFSIKCKERKMFFSPA